MNPPGRNRAPTTVPRSLIVVRNTRSNHAVHECVRQRKSVARVVTAPFMGDVQRRKGDHRVGERLLAAQVPADRPEMLDEAASIIRRRPPIEVEQRHGTGAADHATQRGGLRFVLSFTHAVQATKGPDCSGKPMPRRVACSNLYPYVIRTLFAQALVAGRRGGADLRRRSLGPVGYAAVDCPPGWEFGPSLTLQQSDGWTVTVAAAGRGVGGSATAVPTDRRPLWRGTGEGGSDGMTVAFGIGWDNGIETHYTGVIDQTTGSLTGERPDGVTWQGTASMRCIGARRTAAGLAESKAT